MTSTADPSFLAVVSRWVTTNGEIAAMIRYSRAAGSKDFVIFTSIESFKEYIGKLPPQANVIVFSEKQLCLRGIVNDSFVTKSLASISEGAEYVLMLPPENEPTSPPEWWAGNSHAELRDELEQVRGQMVFLGPYPPWLEDREGVISATTPDADGIARPGVY